MACEASLSCCEEMEDNIERVLLEGLCLSGKACCHYPIVFPLHSMFLIYRE